MTKDADGQVITKKLMMLLVVACVADCSTPKSDSLRVTYHVDEETSVGAFVGNIITDARLVDVYPSADVSSLRFRFLRRRVTGFSLDPVTGVLTTSGRLDREALCGPTASSASLAAGGSCLLRIDVAIQPMQFFRIVRVLVYVHDINDNAPQFPDDVITLSVSESVSVGTLLPLPTAADPDVGNFSVTGYRLQADPDVAETFELEVTRGGGPDGALSLQLAVRRALDREVHDRYSLRVYAVDGDARGASNSGSVEVLINVVDANDNKPVFEGEGRYEVTIPENLPLHTTILRVEAFDEDEGLNGQVVYSLGGLTAQRYGQLFAVNSSTGDLHVRGQIDYEQSSVYYLTIVAADRGASRLGSGGGSGGQSSSASITVYVTDENDHSPLINIEALSPVEGRARTPEGGALGSFVAHVVVSDADAGANGRVSCQLDGRDSNLFRLRSVSAVQDGIDSSSGGVEYQLVTAAVFDRETKAEYQLQVTCHDSAADGRARTSTETLTVDVADVNDNDPVFTQTVYHAELIENNYVGAVVFKNVSATDADMGENADIVYSLQFPWSGVDGFQVDTETGVITATTSTDRERANHVLRFLIVAADRGRPLSRSATATAVVRIVDVNDEAPVFVDVPADGYEFHLAENMPPGTLVGRVTARDADHGRNAVVSYTLSSPDDDEDVAAAFQIDRVTGDIKTTRTLDREQHETVRLIVTATDGASPPISTVANVVVRVLDENDNRPQFVLDLDNKVKVEEMLTVAVSPQLPLGSVVTSLRAVDADADDNAHVTYQLLPMPGCDDAAAGYDVISGGGADVSGDVISAAVPADRRQCGLFDVDAEQGGLTLKSGGVGLAAFDDGTQLNVTVTATDSGVPPLTGTVTVRVVVNSTVPLPTVPTQRQHQQTTGDHWIAILVDEAVVIACLLVVFVVVACCLSAVVVVLATRRARARQWRAKHGYNCRSEEQKALGAAAADDARERSTPSVVVYGSCESPRTVPACNWQDVGSPRAKRNGLTSSRMT